MSFEYIPVESAIPAAGLRMVVVGQVPSPWGEAAKGILHLKRISWKAVRLGYDNDALTHWAGQLSGPVAIQDDEAPLSGWRDILSLAERLAPAPALLPSDPHERRRALELSAMFFDPQGLAWSRRLQMLHAGLTGAGGFNQRVAGYLGQKYGYDAGHAGGYGSRVQQLLREAGAALRERRGAGPYYLGRTLSAVDIYSATAMALFMPLPESQCAMHPASRAAFSWLDDDTLSAIDPLLLEHRDMMYSQHLELPLSL